MMGKIPTQRDQKQLYINARRRAGMREEKNIRLEEKSQVYIIRLFILLVSQYSYTYVSKKKSNPC